MEIRRMSEADVFDVAAIEAKVFSQPWSEQGFRDALAMNHVIFLVAEEAGSILGYCGMYMALDEGEITNVAISEACRNRGYGEQLVTELMQQGRKHGIRRYVLEVGYPMSLPFACIRNLDSLYLELERIFMKSPQRMHIS